MPQFLVHLDDLDPDAGTAVLRGEEARHAGRVLRTAAGDRITLLDPMGRRWTGKVGTVANDFLTAEGLEPLPANEPPLRVTLFQALPKAERWEWILEKGTELGVCRFLPVLTERTVPRAPPGRLREKRHRWEKVALAAAKQCERAVVPQITAPRPFGESLESLGPADSHEVRFALLERHATGETALALPRAPTHAVIAAGPEGGWSPAERTALTEAGFAPWSLGPRILRSETAAVAGLAVLLSRWGDLEAPGAPW
ncbi:MAG: RsmE family RNA methyltransferase [Deferrisomatales bacterium]|nr:RsmE family RNA methyltransferase [Deferrisomatales bacterium]